MSAESRGEATKIEIPFWHRVFLNIYRYYVSPKKLKEFEEQLRLSNDPSTVLPLIDSVSVSVSQEYNKLVNPFAHLKEHNSRLGEKALAFVGLPWTFLHSLLLFPQVALQTVSAKFEDWSKKIKPLKLLNAVLLKPFNTLLGNTVALFDNSFGAISAALKGDPNAKDAFRQALRNAISIALPTAIGIGWAFSHLPDPNECMKLLHSLLDEAGTSAMLATSATWLAVLLPAIGVAFISYKINQAIPLDFLEHQRDALNPEKRPNPHKGIYTMTPTSQSATALKNPDPALRGSYSRSELLTSASSADTATIYVVGSQSQEGGALYFAPGNTEESGFDHEDSEEIMGEGLHSSLSGGP